MSIETVFHIVISVFTKNAPPKHSDFIPWLTRDSNEHFFLLYNFAVWFVASNYIENNKKCTRLWTNFEGG